MSPLARCCRNGPARHAWDCHWRAEWGRGEGGVRHSSESVHRPAAGGQAPLLHGRGVCAVAYIDPRCWLCAREIGPKTMFIRCRCGHVVCSLDCALLHLACWVSFLRSRGNTGNLLCAGTRWTSWSAWPWASTCLIASSRPAPRYVVVHFFL
jgi:hypothetical protein